MPATAHRRTATGSADVNSGRKARAEVVIPPFDDGFRVGVDRPNSTAAAGWNAGTTLRESDLRVVSGDLVLGAGDDVTGVRVTGQVRYLHGTAKLRRSIVEGGVPPGGPSTPTQIRTWELMNFRGLQPGTGVALAEFVTLRPSYRSHDIYGTRGGDYALRRCDIQGVVDGVNLNGTSSVRQAGLVEACWIHDLPFYEQDPRQSDGSHNDGIQAQGNMTDLTIVGNEIEGGATAAILTQQGQGTYDRVLIDRNWLTGDPAKGSTVNASQNSRGPINNYVVTDNRFARSGRSPRFLTPATTLAAATTRISGNVFMDDGSPVPTSNGG